jgi:poly-beta-1,6-N-acetyl-D-glucosamine synthase
MTSPHTLAKGFSAYRGSAQAQYPALEALRGMVQEPERHARKADLRSPSAVPDSGPPRITVLIPAHNEAATIGQTIRSLRRQSIPVSSITVMCDNCTDDTAQIAEALGVNVMMTMRNTARKAGALNQALAYVLPTLGADDLVLTMDADSALSARWLELASRTLRLDPKVGAVCGAFIGEPGAGIIGQLQRNEYFRYARIIQRRWQALVLSGTGTLFRVGVLRQVARERGLSLPGIPGQYYSHASITEDDEMTLAVKTLGWKCLTVAQCETTTEVMPTVKALWTQRMRWQQGTLGDLHAYGLTKMTFSYWLRQAGLYGGFAVSYACLFVLIAALVIWPQFSLWWTGGVLSITLIERTWTVRRAGWRGMLLAALIVPEQLYSLWQGWLFFAAAVASLQRREIAWGHLAREVTA